jgi:hypothetical protein
MSIMELNEGKVIWRRIIERGNIFLVMAQGMMYFYMLMIEINIKLSPQYPI